MLEIYVDGDACPVKDEVIRVAERHEIMVYVVSNAWMRLPKHPLVEMVVVDAGPDVADDWIAERVGPGDIAITADIPLAKRCLDQEAEVLGSTGKPFTEESIGMALAMRDLNAHLRETGEIKGYNASFSKQDRSRFLQALEQTIQLIKRRR
ncbi:MAG: YaiI/YqxD family protein [Rhodospirillaceae bacterium]|jgi:hypothetical protein|nr:YaiI/YqxD family protein [Rhodospirillales bacterium]MBT3907219.1 YaiI/YqxD family protein [Rhodospirillaceae bacterium]MBT4702146.1 YaiI/YqxD family protein [Rhodospirillaceae bacterium]MBT5036175.1 YaiI/YqxD family protein [Rhodospirillaceae bacterium]MBT6218620.1 YaiI/YqxD family protein [Rhodospirillaceae bacterium]